MLIPHRTPQTVVDLIKASCVAWRSTLSTIRYFIGPVTVIKTLYPILFLHIVIASNQANEQGSLMGLLLIALITTFVMGCCFYAVAMPHTQQPVSSKEVVRLVSQRAMLFLTVWLCCAAAAVLGSLFFVVPGILLYIYMKYAKLIALFDNATITQSIIGSLRLVSGNWWRVFAVEGFIVLASSAAILLAKAISFVVTTPLGMLGSAQASYQTMVNSLGVFVAVLIVQVIILPLVVNLHILQLHDLKLRHRLQRGDGISHDTVIC